MAKTTGYSKASMRALDREVKKRVKSVKKVTKVLTGYGPTGVEEFSRVPTDEEAEGGVAICHARALNARIAKNRHSYIMGDVDDLIGSLICSLMLLQERREKLLCDRAANYQKMRSRKVTR